MAGGKSLETTDARKKAAKSGKAMPDGSYPMQDLAHVKKAIKAIGRTNPAKRAKVRALIMKRLRELGRTDLIPQGWRSGATQTSHESADAVELAITPEQENKNFQNRERPAPKKPARGRGTKRGERGSASARKKAKDSTKSSARAASWDEGKHPRRAAGSPAGGEFAPAGQARDERGAKAQKNTKAAEDYKKAQGKTAAEDIKNLNDAELNNLSEYLYSFKSNDPRVVKARVRVALELRKRGRDVNDHGGLGKGRAPGKGSSRPPAKAKTARRGSGKAAGRSRPRA